MTTAPDFREPAARTGPAPYRGLSGALFYGLVLVASVSALGGIGGILVWGATRDGAFALDFVGRIFLLGWAVGAGGALARLVTGWESDRLFSWDCEPGDLGTAAALALAVTLPGFVMERLPREADERAPAEGQPVELAGPTLDGGRFDLADHRGRVVLVDFWATWCGPCLHELPNIEETYERFRDQGLEVVSVSLDFDREDLTRFLERRPLPWPQIFFDEDGQRGWDNPLVGQYGIRGIPYLMIVDQEGKVAAENVRGTAIPAAVAAALGDGPGPLGRARSRLTDWIGATIFKAPWWLIVASGIGGALVVSLAEAAVRRMLPRNAASDHGASAGGEESA